MAKYSGFLILILLFACSGSHKATSDNEWIQLFNGKDINDWTVKVNHHDVGVNFGNTFRYE